MAWVGSLGQSYFCVGGCSCRLDHDTYPSRKRDESGTKSKVQLNMAFESDGTLIVACRCQVLIVGCCDFNERQC